MTLQTQLEEIRKRVEAATEGPWYNSSMTITSGGTDVSLWATEKLAYIITSSNRHCDDKNADLIAHSRTDIPKLLRAVEVMMGAIRKIDSDEYEESPYTITGEAIEKVEKIFGIKNDQR